MNRAAEWLSFGTRSVFLWIQVLIQREETAVRSRGNLGVVFSDPQFPNLKIVNLEDKALGNPVSLRGAALGRIERVRGSWIVD